MGWTWVDAVVLAIVFLYAWQGYERGMVVALGEVVVWVLAWMVGFLLSHPVAVFLVTFLGVSNTTARGGSILLLVLLAYLIGYRALVEAAYKVPRQYLQQSLQTLLGWVPSLVSGVLAVGFIQLVLVALPFNYPYKQEIEQSGSYAIYERWYAQARTSLGLGEGGLR